MNVCVALLAASIVASNVYCVEEVQYDEAEKICLMTEEDKVSLEGYKLAGGKVWGKKTNFLLKEIPFRNKSGERQWLRAGVVHRSFMRMVADAQKQFKFGVNSSYRTWAHQMRLWRRKPNIASNPWRAGPRSHMTGYAVDFSGTYAFVPKDRASSKWFSKKYCYSVPNGFKCPTRFFWWLRRNARKYGFENTVKSEPWHWKYVGKRERRKLLRR